VKVVVLKHQVGLGSEIASFLYILIEEKRIYEVSRAW
jgi:hypothetical protein